MNVVYWLHNLVQKELILALSAYKLMFAIVVKITVFMGVVLLLSFATILPLMYLSLRKQQVWDRCWGSNNRNLDKGN